MSGPKISANTFFKHHENLLKKWKEGFDNFDCLIILNGKDDGQKRAKTTAMNVWYFGYDFLETILVLLKNEIIILASEKKMKLVNHFEEEAKIKNFKITLISKDPKDNSKNFQAIQDTVKENSKHSKPVIGSIEIEKQSGPFAEEYYNFFQKNSEIQIQNCAPLFQEVLAVKDEGELDYIKKACKLASCLEDKLIQEIEGIIDKEEKVKQDQISKKLIALLDKEDQAKKIVKKCNVDVNYFDFSYDPLIQSGGNYDFKQLGLYNDQFLSQDTIVTAVGVQYHQYNANIARTLFIDPAEDQKELYKKMDKFFTEMINSLTVGTKLSELYEKLSAKFIDIFPEIKDKLPEYFGYSIGLELAEDILMISPTCTRKLTEGMVFNVLIMLQNLPSSKKNYSIYLSDTVIIQKSGGVSMTADVSRKYEEVSYNLEADGQDENGEEEEGGDEDQSRHQKKEYVPKTRTTRGAHIQNENATIEQKRKDHQDQLKQKKQEELEKRLKDGGFTQNKRQNQNLQLSGLQCYKTEKDLPEHMKKNQIYLDSKKYCLLCPINGSHVPFHISLIKNISRIDEVKTVALRINLNFPTTTQIVGNITFPKINDQELGYIKELTFRSKNLEKYNDLIKKVKDLQKIYRLKMQEKQNDDQVEQAQLSIIRGKRPVLKELKVRPNISNKKTSGTLECHNNGFRYHTQKGENIDLIFQNIKHYLFQPCDHEIIICVHFHLHQAITINKKKTNDVQFYMEATLPPEDLVDRRRRGYDNDFDEEEMEKIQRKKYNKEFKGFLQAVTELHPNITFDKPFRKLGFYGSPQRSNLFLQPTVNCLINITDVPFFILTLKDIELCCFERMIGGLKNFDLVFVLKDYDKPIQRITAVPLEHSEVIRDWLDRMDIVYFETTRNLSWNTVLAEIKKDIKGFVEEGGWGPVLYDNEDEDEDEDEIEQDSEFDISSDELSEGSDDSEFSEDDNDDNSEEDDENSASGEDDLSESGNDWDELEKKAAKADEEKRNLKIQAAKAPHKKQPPNKSKR